MLQLFAIFHLNLAYSSIEEAQRPDVVRRCYWPLVQLAQRSGAPIGIEASAFTLETAAAIDPSWLDALRALVAGGRCEFVGSGYAQLIGPLVPARVNAENLRLGHQAYERLLGFRPRLAFVNEQAYSAGLIQHYLDASYDAIVMEWDNPARAHPEWDGEWRYFPQTAAGQYRESIPLVWNKAIAFQQFQRYAHDESTLEEYIAYLASHLPAERGAPRALPMYGNDAEVFDFRPGRYHTEAALPGNEDEGEWSRIERLFAALAGDARFKLIRPSETLALMDQPQAAHRLHLESAEDPTPVKKQRKYNITRWAVTGRNNLGINTACWRIYDRLVRAERSVPPADSRSLSAEPGTGEAQVAAALSPSLSDAKASALGGGTPSALENVGPRDNIEKSWRELCELWSSDYRTHITDARWEAYQDRLATVARRLQRSDPGEPKRVALQTDTEAVTRDGPLLTLKNDGVTLVLNTRRGLAIHALSFGDNVPLCGTLKHGFYDDIHWGADFYSGMTVLESPGEPKIADLNRVDPVCGRDASGDLVVEGAVPTALGAVVKTIRLPRGGGVELTYRLEWPGIPFGSLRLGDVTLNPRAFDRATLFYRCHNGGARPETFPLDRTRVAHGDAVSFLVSASHGVGITEGVVELGDATRTLRIEVDKTMAAAIGLVTYQPVRDSYFCRISFSAAEVDETRRKMIAGRSEPLVCRFVITEA